MYTLKSIDETCKVVWTLIFQGIDWHKKIANFQDNLFKGPFRDLFKWFSIPKEVL